MTDRRDIDVPELRLGVVPYLNVQPLIYGLAENWPSLELIPAPPSELDRMLARNEIDLGILPVFAAFLDKDRAILPAPVIASAGPVQSVVIAANQPIEELRAVYRDPNSMTSNALATVLIDRVWDGKIELTKDPWAGHSCPAEKEENQTNTSESNNLPNGAGRIIIGDTALRERSNYPVAIDLAQTWTDWTKLPFVFAAWIGHKNTQTGNLLQALEWTLQNNQSRLKEIAAAYTQLTEISIEEKAKYLTENLTYNFNQPEEQAIERFHNEAKKLGLCADEISLAWL